MLGFLPEWLRGVIFLTAGAGLAVVGAFAFMPSSFTRYGRAEYADRQQAVRAFLQRQQQAAARASSRSAAARACRSFLRGPARYTDNITAIVTVADDGGSSGRLRRQTGMLPPGTFATTLPP